MHESYPIDEIGEKLYDSVPTIQNQQSLHILS